MRFRDQFPSWKQDLISVATERDQTEIKESKILNLTFKGYYSRLLSVALLVQGLRETNQLRTFNSCLDVGCGAGIQTAIISGTLAHSVDGIDHVYRIPSNLGEVLKRHNKSHYKIRLLSWAEMFPWFGIPDGIARVSPSKHWELALGTTAPVSEAIRLKFKREPEIRHIYRGDFASTEITEKYDLIVAFNALNFFEPGWLVDRVSSLLNDNGVFFHITASFFNQTNSAGLITDEPYLWQRSKSKSEFMRVVKKIHPEDVSLYDKAFDGFPSNQCTLSALTYHGIRSGLYTIWSRMFIPTSENHKRGPCAIELAKKIDLKKYFDEIVEVHPFVTPIDLFASKSASLMVKGLSDSNLRHETHSNRFYSVAKSLYLKFFANKK